MLHKIRGSFRSNNTYLDLVYLSGIATTYTARSSSNMLIYFYLSSTDTFHLYVLDMEITYEQQYFDPS